MTKKVANCLKKENVIQVSISILNIIKWLIEYVYFFPVSTLNLRVKILSY